MEKENIIKKNKKINVFVFCSGKSGGTTLSKTLYKNNYNIIHYHTSVYSGIFNSKNNNLYNINVLDLIKQNMSIHNEIYIIDSYRTPIERKISSFFQNLNILDYSKNIKDLINDFNTVFLNIENYHSINEVFDYFKIDNFNKFDFEKRYNLYKHKNINIIKLRFADINDWNKILSEIFQKEIIIYSDNISENKEYKDVYKKFKKQYKIPKDYLETILNDKTLNIYMSSEEKEEYKKFWEQNIDYDYKYINIPEDFDPETYILLNEDLNHLSLLEAKIHYNNYGYLEKHRNYKYINIPEDFDPETYILFNQDLKHLSLLEAKMHYNNYGYLEKHRNYKFINIPEDFDPEIYIKLNEDLKHFSLLEAKIHYNNVGYVENRIYRFNQIPKRFNFEYYINWIQKKKSDKKYDLPFSGFI